MGIEMTGEERFGEYLRKCRLKVGLSLRAFCLKHGEDASNWSKMERGILKPPSSAMRLLEIAKGVGLGDDPEAKQKLYDLADIERGRIPKDIMDNKTLVRNLPVVFRTMRGDAPTEEELMKLADIIREEKTERNEEAQ